MRGPLTSLNPVSTLRPPARVSFDPRHQVYGLTRSHLLTSDTRTSPYKPLWVSRPFKPPSFTLPLPLSLCRLTWGRGGPDRGEGLPRYSPHSPHTSTRVGSPGGRDPYSCLYRGRGRGWGVYSMSRQRRRQMTGFRVRSSTVQSRTCESGRSRPERAWSGRR